MIKLSVSESNDTYKDYNIINNHTIVGILQTVEQKDSIFIRQIHIYDNYKRNGFALIAVNELLKYGKSLGFCIATNSQSAMPFWMSFLNVCRKNGYETINVRGNIWNINKAPTKL